MSNLVVAPYSTPLPELLESRRDELRDVFEPAAIRVQHIGSTAVPGLAAKPVIDILFRAPSPRSIRARIDALTARDCHYVPAYERELPTRLYLVRTAELRDRHAALKLRLAQAHPQDESACIAAKDPLIRGVFDAVRRALPAPCAPQNRPPRQARHQSPGHERPCAEPHPGAVACAAGQRS